MEAMIDVGMAICRIVADEAELADRRRSIQAIAAGGRPASSSTPSSRTLASRGRPDAFP